MGLQTESIDVITRPGDSTGVGTTVVTMGSTGVAVTSPAKFKDGSNVLHESVILIVDLISTAVDRPVFTPVRGAWVLAGCAHTNRVVGSDGGAVTADIMACDPTEAPASGVTQLSAADAINLKATADTPVSKALATTLEEVTPGKYFGLNVTGTLTAVVAQITLEFKRVR